MSDEIRDVGPYVSVQQVTEQFGNWSRGMSAVLPAHDTVVMLLTESLMLAGVHVSAYEQQVLRSRGLDPVFAQVLSGWLIRAAHPSTESLPDEER
jgi:hypothetical protein